MSVFDMGRDFRAKLATRVPEQIIPFPIVRSSSIAIMDGLDPKTFAERYDAAKTDEERAAIVAKRLLGEDKVTYLFADWAKVVVPAFGKVGITAEAAAKAMTHLATALK